jgi:phage recombination protein Bet
MAQITPAPKTAAQQKAEKLTVRLAQMYGVDPKQLYETLSNFVFRQSDGSKPSPAEMLTVMLICEQYGLNPFAREIFAIKQRGGGILPMISVDGWMRIVHRQPNFDGVRFTTSERMVRVGDRELPESIECSIYIKGLSQPVSVTEYMEECNMNTRGAWLSHPRRMLRHRAFIQCARVAFGLSGLCDSEDLNGFTAGMEGEMAAAAAQTDAALAGAGSAPEVGYAQPVTLDQQIQPEQERVVPTVSTLKLEKRFQQLMDARAKFQKGNFWERAAESINNKPEFSAEEKQWMLNRLEETRKAEEQNAEQPAEQKPAEPAPAPDPEPVVVKEPEPAPARKQKKEPKPQPLSEEEQDYLNC